MKLSTCLFSTLIIASNTIAAPQSRLAKRMERRSTNKERKYQGSVMRPKDSKNSNSRLNAATDETESVSYSENWSGAVINSPPTGQTFNEIAGTVVVPTPSIPSGVAATNDEYAASIWVGIDGNTYSTAILQTGIDVTVDTTGQASFGAWYEWYPDYAYDFDITISAGDSISMYVNATTTTTGTATIENLTTGKIASIDLTSTSALGGQNAEWIVEDFEQNSELVAFANFGNVTFTDCIAKTSESSEGVSSAGIMDIKDDNTILTDVNTISDSSFRVEYTGSSASSSSGVLTTTTVVATPSQTAVPGGNPGAGGPGAGEGDGPNGVNAAWYDRRLVTPFSL